MSRGAEHRETQEYREERMQILDQRLATLRGYQIDRPHGNNDLADQQLAFVSRRYENHKSKWTPARTAVGYFGSMLYHDWEKLDIDLLLIGVWTNEQQNIITEGLEPASQLPGVSPLTRHRTELYDVSLEELTKEAPTLLLDKNEPDYLFRAACMILTAEPLFPNDISQQRIFEKFTRKSKKSCKKISKFSRRYYL